MMRELDNFHRKLRSLKTELKKLRTKVFEEEATIQETLKRRGYLLSSDNPQEGVILPAKKSKKALDLYYDYLKKYSFRLFLRDIIKYRDKFKREDLLHYCSPQSAQNYLLFLQRYGIIDQVESGVYKLRDPIIDNFGTTLEWFIAQVFLREFNSLALWGVRFLESFSGGDYDVIAKVEKRIFYVEAKSSPPKNIHKEEIDEFLQRVDELNPNAAIFLVDTELRLEDKINKMFRWALRERYRKKFPVNKVYKRIFHTRGNLFIINSKPELVTNLASCLRYYFGVLEQPIFERFLF